MMDTTDLPSPAELAAMLESRSANFQCADEFLDLLGDLGLAATRSDIARAALERALK